MDECPPCGSFDGGDSYDPGAHPHCWNGRYDGPNIESNCEPGPMDGGPGADPMANQMDGGPGADPMDEPDGGPGADPLFGEGGPAGGPPHVDHLQVIFRNRPMDGGPGGPPPEGEDWAVLIRTWMMQVLLIMDQIWVRGPDAGPLDMGGMEPPRQMIQISKLFLIKDLSTNRDP